MTEYTIIRKCSTLCTMHEPCSISESGLCAQNNKRPVDYDELAARLLERYYDGCESAKTPVLIADMAQALRELLP